MSSQRDREERIIERLQAGVLPLATPSDTVQLKAIAPTPAMGALSRTRTWVLGTVRGTRSAPASGKGEARASAASQCRPFSRDPASARPARAG